MIYASGVTPALNTIAGESCVLSHDRDGLNGPEVSVSSLISGMIQLSVFLGYGLIFSTNGADVAKVGSMRVSVPVFGLRLQEPLIEQTGHM